ncbi:MAG: peptide deformylase [Bacteroidales bacterium]|nr:peptide deformylase [Bacteroidales bacterium]
MIYPIVVYGSPVLRKVAKEIDKDYPELNKLIEDMFETMYASEGVGLAAPQIGKSIRLLVIDASEMEDEETGEKLYKDFKKVFINPKIVEETGDKWNFAEGCLSLPKLREDVSRNSTVRIQYYDENFEFHDETYDDIPARVIQHEYDHLEGVLFIDHLSPLKKKLLKGKLNAISKLKVDTGYKIKVIK